MVVGRNSMMPNEVKEVFHERAQMLSNRWWDEKKKHPVFIEARFDTPLKPGNNIVTCLARNRTLNFQ